MARTSLSPKRLVIEWRYTPTLEYFSKVDLAGHALEKDFPTWRWKAGEVELLDAKRHCKVGITSHRTVYLCDWVHDSAEHFSYAQEVHRLIRDYWSPEKYTRIGIRSFFAIELKLSFTESVWRVTKRLFKESDDIGTLWGGEVSDVAYVIDSKDSDGWERHLRVGPTKLTEWTARNKVDPELFSEDKQSDKSLRAFTKSLPANPLFLDLDVYSSDFDASEFDNRVQVGSEKTSRAAKALIQILGS